MDEWELFDLQKDPNELRSVYGDAAYADVTDQLKTELKRLRTELEVPEDTRPVRKPPKNNKPKAGQNKNNANNNQPKSSK